MHDIQLVIFDLDRCICDSEDFRKVVVDAMKSALTLTGEERARIEAFIESYSNFGLLRDSGIPNEVHAALFAAYASADLSRCELKTFGDEHHILDITAEKILVTAGFEHLQRDKIRRLEIERFFSEIHVDVVRNDWTHPGKDIIFRQAMEARGLLPHQVAVIGDNPHTELGDGKRLGMLTIQTLRPRVKHWDEADHHIESFAELRDVIPSAFAKKC